MRRFVALIAGLLTGALVGGIVALMFAPSSGKNFQQQIGDSIDRLVGQVRQAADERRMDLEYELHKLRQPQVKLE
ncbi:MAG TPA: YtxH domain-containing protein [Bellilinea sp.]